MNKISEQLLKKLGVEHLNKMQKNCEEAWKKNKDIILLSPTGSGKTLAFLLPILQSLNPKVKGVQTLILTPARELSLQVENVFKSMGTEFKVNCCYGGHSVQTEKNNLQSPPDVLIGTPGRVADHIRRKNFDCKNISTIVLDEFDKALELGFQNEMKEIINSLPVTIKKVLTSATHGIQIPEFTKLASPVELNFIGESKPLALIQRKIIASNKDKLNTLFQLICSLENQTSLVFCNHRDAVNRIGEHLSDMNICCGIFHGGLEQSDRERALIKFRNGSHHLLITTDLASRGLDIPEIRNVVHYQLPKTKEAFVHRNGRTARMNANGCSFLVLAEHEKLPDFIPDEIEELHLNEQKKTIKTPLWETIYVSLGKKEKVNKIDLVGLFLKKGKLKQEEIGKIDVLDHISFVAVKKGLGQKLVQTVKNERIKKKKAKIQLSQ